MVVFQFTIPKVTVNHRLIKEDCGMYREYQISNIPWSKQASIPYKAPNIPIINFAKYSISLKVTKMLNTISYIPGSQMDSILYPWK